MCKILLGWKEVDSFSSVWTVIFSASVYSLLFSQLVIHLSAAGHPRSPVKCLLALGPTQLHTLDSQFMKVWESFPGPGCTGLIGRLFVILGFDCKTQILKDNKQFSSRMQPHDYNIILQILKSILFLLRWKTSLSGRKYLFQENVKGNLLKLMLHIVY